MSVRGRLLLAMSWLACRLPEGLVFRFAELAGDLWYRLAPDRAAQARRNLRRVCQSLAASGKGSPRVRAAATDPKALERLVRSAFRHSARYYLEVARMPGVTPAFVDERLQLETPDLIAEAVVPGKAVLFVGLHFGSVEMAVTFLAFRVGTTVTPDGDHRRSGPAGLLRADARRGRHPPGRPEGGAPGAARRAPQRDPGRSRRRSRPDRRRDPDPVVRGAGRAADGSGDARRGVGGPDLRHDRAARGPWRVPGQADPDRRSPPRAPAASASRSR